MTILLPQFPECWDYTKFSLLSLKRYLKVLVLRNNSYSKIINKQTFCEVTNTDKVFCAVFGNYSSLAPHVPMRILHHLSMRRACALIFLISLLHVTVKDRILSSNWALLCPQQSLICWIKLDWDVNLLHMEHFTHLHSNLSEAPGITHCLLLPSQKGTDACQQQGHDSNPSKSALPS